MMYTFIIIITIFLHLSPVLCGRTTNKYTSLPGGGFHHHGGFLGGYFDFYKGSKDNPADSFSERYGDGAADLLNYRPEDVNEEDASEENYNPALTL